ncbi:hypothetical protein ACMD2_27420 [Ananas comosus]|uniref:Uncharacterized protein n=1 Tax=Ananas comosus TaxID=4615 RepID=A0A199UWA2_ANACO|nr:hypothetical protein ACMD2_27420 [Ananas comosus]
MEAFPYKFTRGIRAYWRRRKYQKLDNSGSRKAAKVARLGAGGRPAGGSRRFWKLRSIFRIRVKIASPGRLLARLRDAYVDAMLGLAGKGGGLSVGNGPDAFWSRRVPRSKPVRDVPGEFERRLIIEVYKSLVASGEIAAH